MHSVSHIAEFRRRPIASRLRPGRCVTSISAMALNRTTSGLCRRAQCQRKG